MSTLQWLLSIFGVILISTLFYWIACFIGSKLKLYELFTGLYEFLVKLVKRLSKKKNIQ